MFNSFIDFEIKFDLGSLIVFFSGAIFGLMVFGLIYLYVVLRTLKKKKYIVESQLENEISEEEIKAIIKEYQEEYLEQRKNKNEEIASNAIKDAIFGVVYSIAKKFFPDSKRPLLELSIDESIMLVNYITSRVDELFGHRGTRIFRKVKLSSIMKLVDTTKTVNNTEIVKKAKKYKFSKILDYGLMALNFINPVYWIKKAVTGITKGFILKKIILMVISIAGEETYKIYSKQTFKEQDPEYIKMMEEINGALDDSDDIDKLNEEQLEELIESLPEEEKKILLSMPHSKNKSWWEKKQKEEKNKVAIK